MVINDYAVGILGAKMSVGVAEGNQCADVLMC